MKLSRAVDTLVHRYLRIPYTLHVYRESRVSRAKKTVVFLHGIGNSGQTWDEVLETLDVSVDFLVVDLLGFGDSPQPNWATYDAPTQAKALAKTLALHVRIQPIVLVGHSMGALVAVEFAKRFPVLVDSLVLCSPPLYNVDKSDDHKLFVERDEQLRRLYEFAVSNPNNIVKLSQLAKRYKLVNPDFDVDHANVDSYVLALRANILNQTTAHDIVRLKKPVTILYGAFDPFVIGGRLRAVAKRSTYISTKRLLVGHEIVGTYVRRVASELKELLG